MRSWVVAGAVALAACANAESVEQQADASQDSSTIITANVAQTAPASSAADEQNSNPGDAPAARTHRDDSGPTTDLPPNELGRIPVVEYHLIGSDEGRWTRTPENFRRDLELLYERGYRPITLRELASKQINLPAGTSPVVFTFDDASPGQFSYIEDGDELRIDPRSAVGIWLDFAETHDGWENRAVFCMLSGAEAGRAFFGNKGIDGQKTEWRHRKVKFLADAGFELCNHTLWHATLSQYDDGAFVQEQIARLQLAVDSAVPGYQLRSFALPLGEWPKNRELARHGTWTNPATGAKVEYEHDIVLLVAGGPTRSPHDPEFDPMRITRVQVFGDELTNVLDRLDRSSTRYISDGDPDTIARPEPTR